ncbi:hypothetical protein DL95DRAFT_385367 [Leptodontidium sp. 2 PMI_412]|nr:hypothetical protein BKA61DRAFT_641171 [Leptodontidium sp. MPI-SDFR-AT-0119]KAH9218345.1 hypothetical protein DL95DRAFT_385367 [Leptodontidium sp. 2 PMI_412]
MSSELVFITGATGFIGAATALAALKAGYRLRISVRKDEQISKLKGIFSDYAEKLDFVVIPDITAEGAFSNALKGVTYVLHMASPLANSTNPEDIFPPAVQGTVGILKDAAKVSSITKVVITSSIAALVPLSGAPEGAVVKEDNDWDLSVDPKGDFKADNDFATSMKVYGASKLLANQASWDFMENEKPGFALVSIHPSLVYGKNIVQQSAKEIEGSTNGLLFSSIMNGPTSDFALLAVYVGDVAQAHVLALKPEIKSGSKYLVSGRPFTWNDVVGILEKHYAGVPYKLVGTGDYPTKVDTTKAETELGIEWATTETIVTEVLNQQLPFFS